MQQNIKGGLVAQPGIKLYFKYGENTTDVCDMCYVICVCLSVCICMNAPIAIYPKFSFVQQVLIKSRQKQKGMPYID